MEDNSIQVRESWLNQAIGVIDTRLFKPQKIALPEKLRISVGFPGGGRRGKGTHRIGECWFPECSADQHTEIFIHPEIADPIDVLAIVIHELVHASGQQGHGKEFKTVAIALGLTGKMTATTAGPELTSTLAEIVKDLPAYPHGALVGQKTDGPKKQGTRMIALTCPGCGYKVRTTQKWIDLGLPQCGCCGLELEPEQKEGV
jgi:hypothetical protein